MNIRKNIDYSQMYEELDNLMAQQLPQMELYCEIGKAVCQRTEKGAAVMASEYLNKQYPDVKGFSPRSLRRMRDFYRSYENHPDLMQRAMQLGWTQNVVIMEAELTIELREWYIKAALQFGWSKTELIVKINSSAYKDASRADEREIEQLLNRNDCIYNRCISMSTIKIVNWLLGKNNVITYDRKRKRRRYTLCNRVFTLVLLHRKCKFLCYLLNLI